MRDASLSVEILSVGEMRMDDRENGKETCQSLARVLILRDVVPSSLLDITVQKGSAQVHLKGLL